MRDLIIHILDVVLAAPGLRTVAAPVLSAWASSLLERRVRLFHDDVWLRTDGEITIALGPRLQLRRNVVQQWKPDAAELTDLARSWWYLFYQPAPGDIIVDVGAGLGEDAILFSRSVGPQGAVYSFEAHPGTARGLRKTIQYSHLANVTPVQAAVFSRTCTLELDDLPEGGWQKNSILPTTHPQSRRTIAVPALALDEFGPLQQQPRIDFIKMNIEGAEIDALRGMPQTLAKTRFICVACHDFLAADNPSMKTKAACRQILADAGFTVHDTDPASPPWQRDQIHGVRST